MPNFSTPGPGNYNIHSRRSWPTLSYDAPKVLCFFKGSDSCSRCENHLYGDYYKASSGRKCLCFSCYRKMYDPIRKTPCSMHKVRHCFTYHKHIDVENIVYHKTTQKKIRRLNLIEKVMWNKFGEMLDHSGRPTL